MCRARRPGLGSSGSPRRPQGTRVLLFINAVSSSLKADEKGILLTTIECGRKEGKEGRRESKGEWEKERREGERKIKFSPERNRMGSQGVTPVQSQR